MRVKRMPQTQFLEVMKREWVPVQLMGNAITSFLILLCQFNLGQN